MSDVFVSHVEQDSDVALQLAIGLEQAGFSIWCYELDSLPGLEYLGQVAEAVEQARAVVLVISPQALGSNQVRNEVVRAYEDGKPIIPVLRDITDAEFKKRQPVWRQCVGAATSVPIPREGVAGILPRITGGLKGLGIRPKSKPDAARVARLGTLLAEVQQRGYAGKVAEPAAPVKAPEVRKRTSRVKSLLIAVASAVVIAAVVSGVVLSGGGGGKEGATPALAPTTTAPATSPAAATPTPAATPAAAAATPSAKAIASPGPTAARSPLSSSTEGPDLVVLDIRGSPTGPFTGDSVTFTVAVTNQGGAGAKSSYVYFFVDGSYQDSGSVASIPAGATTTVDFAWKAESGTHAIEAVADYGNSVPESNEANNGRRINLVIDLPKVVIEAWDTPTEVQVDVSHIDHLTLRNFESRSLAVTLSGHSSVTGDFHTQTVTLPADTTRVVDFSGQYSPAGVRTITWCILYGGEQVNCMSKTIVAR